MIPLVILAAGFSTRMGRSKPLLPHGLAPGMTFLGHLATEAGIAELRHVFVVGRPDDRDLRVEAIRRGVAYVENPAAERGQLTSLQAGLDAVAATLGDAVEAVMVLPVDVPLVSSAVMRQLAARSATSSAAILRATHNGRHGHPVIFKRSVFDELRAADPDVGARAVVRADPGRVENVEMEEAGVTVDVDTPEDYVRAFGRPVS